MEPKASYKKFVIGFLAIIVVAVAAHLIWTNFFKYDINEVYKEAEAKYVEAMTADIYGGKTPKETLDLFVKALKAGDVELASKYFLLDENAIREQWVLRLTSIKDRDLLAEMANDIEKFAKPDLQNKIDENDYKFVLYANDGNVGARINMQFNKYSQLWKIESL